MAVLSLAHCPDCCYLWGKCGRVCGSLSRLLLPVRQVSQCLGLTVQAVATSVAVSVAHCPDCCYLWGKCVCGSLSSVGSVCGSLSRLLLPVGQVWQCLWLTVQAVATCGTSVAVSVAHCPGCCYLWGKCGSVCGSLSRLLLPVGQVWQCLWLTVQAVATCGASLTVSVAHCPGCCYLWDKCGSVCGSLSRLLLPVGQVWQCLWLTVQAVATCGASVAVYVAHCPGCCYMWGKCGSVCGSLSRLLLPVGQVWQCLWLTVQAVATCGASVAVSVAHSPGWIYCNRTRLCL